jgi:hypothetical protein
MRPAIRRLCSINTTEGLQLLRLALQIKVTPSLPAHRVFTARGRSVLFQVLASRGKTKTQRTKAMLLPTMSHGRTFGKPHHAADQESD